MDKQEVIETLRKELPPIIARVSVDRLLGGTVCGRTLSNLDCVGQGPPKVRLGRKIAYPRDSFLEWFAARMTVVEDKKLDDACESDEVQGNNGL